MKHFILGALSASLLIITFNCFVDVEAMRVSEDSMDEGVQHETELEEYCREQVGDSYDKVDLCTRHLYDTKMDRNIDHLDFERYSLFVRTKYWFRDFKHFYLNK